MAYDAYDAYVIHCDPIQKQILWNSERLVEYKRGSFCSFRRLRR
jgi:hypothetical protein